MILIFKVNEDLPYTQAPHTPFCVGIIEQNDSGHVPKGADNVWSPSHRPLEGSVHLTDAIVHPELWS